MLAKIAFGNVRKSVGDFGVYFLTVALGVAVFYAFNSMGAQRGVLELSEQQSSALLLLSVAIGGVSVFIAGVLAFLVVYADRFLIRRRKKEFGLYLLLGMSARDVRRIVFLESGIVGAASLAVGLAVGVGLSQVLLAVTSSLFQADVAGQRGLAFTFSPLACAATVAVFAGVFAIAACANALGVSRARLIDLLQASARVEERRERSLPAQAVLLAVALTLVGAAYALLRDAGIMELTPEFGASCALVCAGTALFFYALSGVLPSAVRRIRPLYLRGLVMFSVRQLGARVNSACASLTAVCLVLFLALACVCGGLGIRGAVESSLERGTAYSATVTTMLGTYVEGYGMVPLQDADVDAASAAVEEHAGDARAGLAAAMDALGAGSFDDLVEGSAQVDYLVDVDDALTFADVEAASGVSMQDTVESAAGEGALSEGYADIAVPLARLSQVNAALALAGKDTLSLAPGECLVMCDNELLGRFWRQVGDSGADLRVGGRALRIAGFDATCLETTAFPAQSGAVVVEDAAVPEDAVAQSILLDVQTSDDGAAFARAVEMLASSDDPTLWPTTMVQARADVAAQSATITALVGYLAIYLGLVLTIACAAILAVQQLSDASDNASRYGLLRKLGAPQAMADRALLFQVLVYFLLPLLLAAAHAACALSVVVPVVEAFGHLDITATVAGVAAAFVAIYGAYFLVTYAGARRLARG